MKRNITGQSEENVICILKPAAIYAFGASLGFLVLSVGSAIAAMYVHPYIIILSIIFAIIVWIKYLYIASISYTITTETIMVKKGIIGRTFNSIELFRVKDHQISQSVGMRIFGLMKLTIFATDLSDPTLHIEGVPMDLSLVEKIRELVNDARIKNRIFEIN